MARFVRAFFEIVGPDNPEREGPGAILIRATQGGAFDTSWGFRRQPWTILPEQVHPTGLTLSSTEFRARFLKWGMSFQLTLKLVGTGSASIEIEGGAAKLTEFTIYDEEDLLSSAVVRKNA